MAINCPKCNSIIYSRMASICPDCHAPLPKELLPTEKEIAKRKIADQKMKQWLREEDVKKDAKRDKEFKITGRNLKDWINWTTG
jgi:hypothetical protein